MIENKIDPIFNQLQKLVGAYGTLEQYSVITHNMTQYTLMVNVWNEIEFYKVLFNNIGEVINDYLITGIDAMYDENKLTTANITLVI